jgi:hypothetical protein
VRQYLVVQDDATHSVLGDVAAAPFDAGLSTSFRGRLFCGQRRRLPPHCSGVVMRAEEQETDAPQHWSVAHSFDELCVWQRERPIVDADKINTWFAWPRLAAIVNRPLTAELVAAAAARVAAGEFKRSTTTTTTTNVSHASTASTVAPVESAAESSTSTTTKRKRDQSPPVVGLATASPRRSPRVKSTPTKRKKDDEKMSTPATETKAPPTKMSTPASEESPKDTKRRRVVRRLDNDNEDDES